MNPFSTYLRQWSGGGDFGAFIDQWDALERVVISVYRGKMAPEAVADEFERLLSWLRESYDQWEEALRHHWQATRAAGKPTQTDPFQLLLTIPNAQAIVGDWRAMQHLPAAREAINRYLLAVSQHHD